MVLKKSRYDLFIIRGLLIVSVEGEKCLEADAKEKYTRKEARKKVKRREIPERSKKNLNIVKTEKGSLVS